PAFADRGGLLCHTAAEVHHERPFVREGGLADEWQTVSVMLERVIGDLVEHAMVEAPAVFVRLEEHWRVVLPHVAARQHAVRAEDAQSLVVLGDVAARHARDLTGSELEATRGEVWPHSFPRQLWCLLRREE